MKRVCSRWRRGAIPALAVLALTLAGHASAAPLEKRLTRALTVPGVSWRATGASAIDLRTGRYVYRRHDRRSLRPASNEKLAVAVAVLDELGPRSRIPTRVLGQGRRDRSVWRGRLVLKGYGDPTLSTSDLRRLARRVRAAGIRRVTGRLMGDESYFNTRRTAPGWKPSFYKQWCPPLSALIVNEGIVGRRTVDHPARAATRAFRRALRAVGVFVPRGVTIGRARPGLARIARILSPRLSALVRRMNKESNNFIAESLLKHLGARELGRGSTGAGARVARRVLRDRGVHLAGVRIVDGSGLSRYNRMTARALAELLVSAWKDGRIRYSFFTSLPLAGIDGTLEDRMTSRPARGRVRGKTGTTRNASALSGYVGRRYVFSVLQNGNPIPWWYARRGQDRFAQVLAAQ